MKLFLFLILFFVSQYAYALTEEYVCQPPPNQGLSKLVERKELIIRLKQYDTKGYFQHYLLARDYIIGNEKDVEPPPNHIKMELYPAYTGSHLGGIGYNFVYDSSSARNVLREKHSIGEQEKIDILMLINLITGNPIKSKEIFDGLYAQYLSKVESQEFYRHCENRGIIVAQSIYDEVDYVLVGSVFDDNGGRIWYFIAR